MIIQCDFDGTIPRNNLSVLLRQRFARGDWQKIESDYLDGNLTVEQSNRLQYALIKEPKERLQEFVSQHVEVRPGFTEFASYCQDTGVPLVIVSSGLDFYIETALVHISMEDLEVHSGQTSFGKDGIAVSYTDPAGNTTDEGFKRKYLTWLRKRDSTIVYIGDGLSDSEAARGADHIFATDHLLRLLRAESVVCNAFSDFHDVLSQVRQL